MTAVSQICIFHISKKFTFKFTAIKESQKSVDNQITVKLTLDPKDVNSLFKVC